MLQIGIDEVGRGALVGNVVVAALILNDTNIEGIADSKKLTQQKRQQLYDLLCTNCRFSIAQASSREIERLNIHNATLLAMDRALTSMVEQHQIDRAEVIIDGRFVPSLHSLSPEEKSALKLQAIVKADVTYPCVSAASIMAKVTRDKQMDELHQLHPQYGFNQNKGYPTKQHLDAIQQCGIIKQHRTTYKGVREHHLDGNAGNAGNAGNKE